MTSQRLEDFVGLGTSGDRPVSLDLPTTCAGFRYETDTGTWVWDGSIWVQITGTGLDGINELTGDVEAGPGNGSQAATITAGAVTTAKMADMDALTFLANATASPAAPQYVDPATAAGMLFPYLPTGGVFAETHTTDYTIVPADSGKHFDNIGAGGAVEFDLPPLDIGMVFAFVVFEAEFIKINADGTDTISLAANASSAGGYIQSDVPGSVLIIEAHDAGRATATVISGTWDIDGGTPFSIARTAGSTTDGNAAIWDADGNLVDAGAPPGGGAGFTPVTKTSDYTVLTGDSGTDFNNDGAGADIVLSLPAAAPELVYSAAVHDADYIKFLADGTDKIAIGSDNSSAGGYVRSNLPYSYIELRCHIAGQWVAATMIGSWGIDL